LASETKGAGLGHLRIERTNGVLKGRTAMQIDFPSLRKRGVRGSGASSLGVSSSKNR
jgi:hypothetical protein